MEKLDRKLLKPNYVMPPFALMNEVSTQCINENEDYKLIIKVLHSFKISLKSISRTIGATVTSYKIVLEDGVKYQKVKDLENDIALALSVNSLRMELKDGYIGIEVPNAHRRTVSLKEIIVTKEFGNRNYELPIGLGQTVDGKPFVVDLAKMPHLLVAGATGQGKSVGLNAIISSLLFAKHPEELEFVLIDPKRVEFSFYSKLEKLFLGNYTDTENAIVTDVRNAEKTLYNLCYEMERRYKLLESSQTRNIVEYNNKFDNRQLDPRVGHFWFKYTVVIIDEFADLIMTAGANVETYITRLAQMARAVGIHLIIATQRPTTDVITGKIKANFLARLAFRVASKVDSRTILDRSGAEALVGKGDLIFSNGIDDVRLQCPFVDSPEILRIVKYIASQKEEKVIS